MKKVSPGQKLDKTAQTWNSIIEATQFFQENQAKLSKEFGKGIITNRYINIENTLSEDLNPFSILCLKDSVTIEKTENEQKFFFETPCFEIEKYSSVVTKKLRAKIVITTQGIKQGYIGKAVYLGIVPVLISVSSASHLYVEPHAIDITKMLSSSRGRGKILWKESGTGDKYGLVELLSWPWFNFTPSNPYIIDRSDATHDIREWNPDQDKPTDWKDYDGLQYTTENLRYRSGASASLKYVKTTQSWLTEFAPIISLPTVTDAEVGEC